jgi:hypothetical protein
MILIVQSSVPADSWPTDHSTIRFRFGSPILSICLRQKSTFSLSLKLDSYENQRPEYTVAHDSAM